MSGHNENLKPEDLYTEHKRKSEELGEANTLLNEIDSESHTASDKDVAIEIHDEARKSYDKNIDAAKQANATGAFQAEALAEHKDHMEEDIVKEFQKETKDWVKINKLSAQLASIMTETETQSQKSEDRGIPVVEIHESDYPKRGRTETVRELLESGESQDLKEVLDFVNSETANCFNPEELTPDELKELSGILSKSKNHWVVNAVKDRLEKLDREDFEKIFTPQEKINYKRNTAGGERLTEHMVVQRLRELNGKLLNDEEIEEIRRFISRKDSELDITSDDKKALRLIIKSYGERMHEGERIYYEDMGPKIDGLYNDHFREILSTDKTDLSATELSQVLLASEFLLDDVIPRRRVKYREESKK